MAKIRPVLCLIERLSARRRAKPSFLPSQNGWPKVRRLQFTILHGNPLRRAGAGSVLYGQPAATRYCPRVGESIYSLRRYACKASLSTAANHSGHQRADRKASRSKDFCQEENLCANSLLP